ncbi:LysR family transcriptional regulator [Roseovarius rhodophyticola]|uniref:LysR family transcriptional regulator n=1 Tax=Roseovarius rhodophyticola TaxID=3080827 RepID=A0ABZ2THJ0_9RHOB|nr:LysR family transcriptional regulator [Roseovarius sp. W115]MDV2928126.1 LysR family transcriptional regulator [Roseovarius sp. W115]
MNLQQLTVFRDVMKTGSVSAAARNLHRTQPAISASLKALEATLGVTLFHREGRRLSPTPEAHYLLSEAVEILDRLNLASSNLSELRNRTRGSLRIAAMPGTSAYLMPEFVSGFVAEKDDVQVALATRSSPQILSMIAAQSFDVGFCDMQVDEARRDLVNSVHIRSNCVVAFRHDHRLAGHERVRATDLNDEPMGTLHDGHRVYTDTERAFRQVGARFNVRVEAQFFMPLFHFIEAGQICAVVDVMSAESYRRLHGDSGQIRFANFEPAVPFGYSIVSPKQRPPSLLAGEFASKWESFVRSIVDHV